MSDKVPDWAEKVAGDLALEYVDWIGRSKVDGDAEHVLAASVASALLSAYRRGVEDSAKVADKRAKMACDVNHPAAVSLLVAMPDAIRRLGEAE